MSLKLPYASRFLTPISSAICIWSREQCIPLHYWNMAQLMRMHVELYSYVGDKYYPHSCYDIFSRTHSQCVVEEELPHLSFERYLSQANLSDLIWEILIKFGRPWIWMLSQEICHQLSLHSFLWQKLHLILGEQHGPFCQSTIQWWWLCHKQS